MLCLTSRPSQSTVLYHEEEGDCLPKTWSLDIISQAIDWPVVFWTDAVLLPTGCWSRRIRSHVVIFVFDTVVSVAVFIGWQLLLTTSTFTHWVLPSQNAKTWTVSANKTDCINVILSMSTYVLYTQVDWEQKFPNHAKNGQRNILDHITCPVTCSRILGQPQRRPGSRTSNAELVAAGRLQMLMRWLAMSALMVR